MNTTKEPEKHQGTLHDAIEAEVAEFRRTPLFDLEASKKSREACVSFLRKSLTRIAKVTERNAYWSPCLGCPEGHPSFWKTIVESDEWKRWEEVANEKGFDYDESRECGYLSPEHWQAFLAFLISR